MTQTEFSALSASIAAMGSGSAAPETQTFVVTLNTPVLNLSEAEGAQIAGAILAVWALGWCIRAVIRALSIDGNSSTSESE